jgi:hypothetical protein
LSLIFSTLKSRIKPIFARWRENVRLEGSLRESSSLIFAWKALQL